MSSEQEEGPQQPEEEVITDAVIIDQFKAWIDAKYYDYLSAQTFAENPVFEINYDSILSYNPYDLPKYFQTNIDQAFDCLKVALSEKMLDIDIMRENKNNKPDLIQVRIQNYSDAISLRDIQTMHNKNMIVVNCIISKASEPKPFMIKSVYLCPECGHHQPSLKNTYIKKCPSCESDGRMVLDTSKSIFTSACTITVQDLPEDLPPGQMPMSKHVTVLGDDLAYHQDKCRPGSRIKLTAIVRLGYDATTLIDVKANTDPLGILEAPSTGTTFSLDLTANNIELLGENDKVQRTNTLSSLEIEKIESYKSSRLNLHKTLLNSFAPHIFGNEQIKLCLLLALVSTNSSNYPNADYKKRGDINILLVGNASVAKSQLMLFAARISPRCIYVSGRGSTGVGLTASVQKDEKTGAMMLEAGACVLADQGVCIIDEFDKLHSDARSALHEIMEQQTCSVAKGGIVATLNARTCILAAANPINGTYDSYKTLTENTGYPVSLISRFDFIFVLKDIIDEKRDSDIANIILLGPQEKTNEDAPRFDAEFLTKYIQYAKSFPDPQLTPDASELIRQHYVMLRKKSDQDKDGSVTALTVTARLVDSLKRAATAYAKLHQKNQVDKEDVWAAIKLISSMYASFGIVIPDEMMSIDLKDNVKNIPTINLGLMYGKPASKVSKKRVFYDILDGVTMNGKIEEVDSERLIFEMVQSRKFVTRYEAEDILHEAERYGILTHRKGTIYVYNREALQHDSNI